MKLGEKILFLRKRDGMSQEELANKIDVSRQTVYKWESDAATPEIEKIKQLTKLFNVSFDYLMDDDVDSVNTEKKETPPSARRYRNTYNPGYKIEYYQADKDHGYTSDSKSLVKNSFDIFSRVRWIMKSSLSKIGADTIIMLQDDIAGCFFENTTEMFFGFYLNGRIQFLCPIENFISARLSDSGQEMSYENQVIPGVGFGSSGIQSIGMASIPRPVLNKPKHYTIYISYIDEDGQLSNFQLSLHCGRIYTIYESKSPRETLLKEEVRSDSTRRQLNDLLAHLDGYPVIAREIMASDEELDEIDWALVQASDEESKQLYSREIEKRDVVNPIWSTLGTILGIGLPIALVILIIVLLFKWAT